MKLLQLITWLILLLSPVLNAQFNRECLEFDEWELPGGETLCEEIDDFDADHTIGLGPGSTSYWSVVSVAIGTPFIANKDIIINGTLIIDRPARFYSCRVKMGNDARIIIHDQYYLFSYFSKWFSCTTMWEGIQINEGGSLRSFYSKYEDAKYLITVDDGGILSILGNTFNRNHIVLRNGHSSDDYEGMIFSLCQSNTFTCTSELNETDLSDITYAGVYLDRGVASIGHLYATNYFTYMYNGVVMYESTLNLTNIHFDRILEVASGSSGYGIYSEGGTVQVKALFDGEEWIGQSVFEDCQFLAIECLGTNLFVEGAIFQGDMFGAISSHENGDAPTVTILDNYFDLDDDNWIGAIGIERGTGSGNKPHYVIRDNTFDVGEIDLGFASLAGFGIIALYEFPAIDEFVIEDNIFTTDQTNGSTMIWVVPFYADKFITDDNDITCISDEFNAGSIGIYYTTATGGIEHLIKDNTVISNGSHQPLHMGIAVEAAPEVTLCDNTVNDTEVGIRLAFDNDPLYLKNTWFGSHVKGLYLSNRPMNGTQLRFGNLWSSTQSDYSEWAAECDGDPTLNKFEVEDDDPSTLPPKRTPGGDAWFIEEDGATNYCVELVIANPYITLTDTLIVTEDAFDTAYTKAEFWGMKKNLMYKLMRFDSLISKWSAAETFYEEGLDSTYGKHASIEYAYFNAMLISDSLQNVMDSIGNLIFDALTELSHVDTVEAREIDSLALDSTVIANSIVWLDSLKKLSDSLRIRHDYLESQQDDLVSDLEGDAANLPASTTYESNSKTLIEVQISHVLNDTVSASEYSQLLSVSNQSIDTGGMSVLMARFMVAPCSSMEFNDFAEEESGGRIRGPELNEKAEMEMYVLGNPSHGLFDVAWSDKATGSLYVVDLVGRELFVRDIRDERQVTVDVRMLSDGVGLVVFKSDQGYVLSSKVVVLGSKK